MGTYQEIRRDGTVKKSGSGKIVGGCIAAVAAIIVATSSFTIVPAGHTGVILTLGKVSNTSYSEGFHLKVPFTAIFELTVCKSFETADAGVS